MRSEGTPEPTGETAHEEANPAARGIRVAGYDLPLKWLVIGGVTVVVAVIVVAVVFALGSIGTSTSNTLLAFVPSDSTSVHLQETKMILSGSAPDKYLDAYESAWEYLDDLGFSIYEIERQVESTDIESGNRLLVLQGDFVFADIRDELSETWNYQDSEYRGNELWEGRDWAWAAVALFEQENIVLMANRREAIREVFRNLEDGSGSLADEKDSRMRQFLEETSDGWVVHPVLDDCNGVDRCQALAYSLTERGRDSANIDITMLFSSDRAAERAADDYDQVYDFLNTRTVYGGTLEVDDIESRGNIVHAKGIAWFD